MGRYRIVSLILVVALFILMFLGLIYGSVNIPFRSVLAILMKQDQNSKNAIIINTVRFPRVLAGVLAGAGLGTAGVILQSIMNNSLASPNTIGVNSGAGFLVMLSMMILPHSMLMRSFMAFVGAFFTSVIILCLAYVAEKSRMTIVLAGITISSFLTAGMNMLKILDPDVTVGATHFLIGSLSGVTMGALGYPAIGIICGIAFSIVFSKALNILSLGDGTAFSLGLKVNRFRVLFVLVASILSGLVVSFAGLIGFVGLIVPHICRYLVGNDARRLIPVSALMGSVFILLSDLISRTIFSPYELPVGILLSLTGGPFFLYLLMKKGGRRLNA